MAMVTATEAATSRPRKMRQAGVEARQIAGSNPDDLLKENFLSVAGYL